MSAPLFCPPSSKATIQKCSLYGLHVHTVNCQTCQKEVICSPASKALIDDGTVHPLCEACAVAIGHNINCFAMTQSQVEELQSLQGYTPRAS